MSKKAQKEYEEMLEKANLTEEIIQNFFFRIREAVKEMTLEDEVKLREHCPSLRDMTLILPADKNLIMTAELIQLAMQDYIKSAQKLDNQMGFILAAATIIRGYCNLREEEGRDEGTATTPD